LHLVGNVGNQIDVSRTGAFYGGTGQPADDFKTIFGVWNGVNNQGNPVTYSFIQGDVNPNDTRRRNAQREPGVTNVFGPSAIEESVDGGVFLIGGIWNTQATGASTAFPNSVAALPAPTTTTFAANNPIIGASGDYVNAFVTFTTGPEVGQGLRVITATSNTNQQITVGQAYPTPGPTIGNNFTITASEQAGTGRSTFVTDSGPSVLTHNSFQTVVSDFGTQRGFLNFNTDSETPFPFGWRTVPLGTFGSPFP
jgi:hypothetical protein